MSPRAQEPLTIEYVLMGLVNQHPMHGYDIYKKMQQIDGLGSVWRVKQANVYALLERFEGMGWLTSEVISNSANQSRKEYQLSPLGREEFNRWIISPVNHGRDMRQEFLARLYFAREMNPEWATRLIDAQLAECHSWLDLTNSDREKASVDDFSLLVVEFRASQIQAMIGWLEEIRHNFQ